jgi:hypothetical protein
MLAYIEGVSERERRFHQDNPLDPGEDTMSTHNITDFVVGMTVIIGDGTVVDEGTVERIDEDENIVWVQVPTRSGVHLEDFDPADLEIKEP